MRQTLDDPRWHAVSITHFVNARSCLSLTAAYFFCVVQGFSISNSLHVEAPIAIISPPLNPLSSPDTMICICALLSRGGLLSLLPPHLFSHLVSSDPPLDDSPGSLSESFWILLKLVSRIILRIFSPNPSRDLSRDPPLGLSSQLMDSCNIIEHREDTLCAPVSVHLLHYQEDDGTDHNRKTNEFLHYRRVLQMPHEQHSGPKQGVQCTVYQQGKQIQISSPAVSQLGPHSLSSCFCLALVGSSPDSMRFPSRSQQSLLRES